MVEKSSGLDPFTVEHFRAWVAQLTLDSGRKFRLEPFQEAFLADLFEGRPENWFILPEGNGKSTLVAALGLYHCRFTEDAWVPVAAAAKDQARIIYRQAAGFVRRGGAWGFRAFDGYRKIVNRETGSELEIFSADERTGDGIIPTLCFLDELHRHRTLDLYETWRGKLWKRGAQLVTISTAGEPGSEFEETRLKIREMGELERHGSFTRVKLDSILLHEWAVPTSEDVEDMERVKAANPLSKITVATLTDKFSSPTMTPGHWRRFTCNQPTRGEFAAVSEQEWADAYTDEEIPEGEPISIGLDLGWKWDTTAIVPLWVKDREHRLFGIPKILTPPRNGDSMSARLIEEALLELHERNPIRMVVMDMSVGGRQMADWIDDQIRTMIVDRGTQNKDAAEDYSSFMEALREGWLKQPGHPEFTRHVLNAHAKILPQGDTRFVRPMEARISGEQDRRVIDALVAAAMVNHVACLDHSEPFAMAF